MRRFEVEIDMYGDWHVIPDTAGMHQPAQCAHCNGVYDLGTVEVTARYTDCSMWKAPCCGVLVDDRGETGWKTFKDYRRLDRTAGGTQ
ncbi:hypothetical protein BBK14_33435 [Parafrankia soli]|uniref:Uncharacterized protein n=1 Tax=Parafrankia soli TaxID=2599596 RepID=A0A1S1QSM9_9ACTN|nr:hypothetical protein [Parafrankia soli]OHV35394.1 hypothetical protein BBK14_33435 [Parafrankia soli]